MMSEISTVERSETKKFHNQDGKLAATLEFRHVEVWRDGYLVRVLQREPEVIFDANPSVVKRENAKQSVK